MRHRCGNIVRADAECQYIHLQVLASTLAHSTDHYPEMEAACSVHRRCENLVPSGLGSLSVPLLNSDVLQPALVRDPGTVKGYINYTACQEFIISRSADTSDLYIKCGRSSHAGSASVLKVGNAMSELHATFKLAMCGDSGCGKVSFSPRLSATAFIYIETAFAFRHPYLRRQNLRRANLVQK